MRVHARQLSGLLACFPRFTFRNFFRNVCARPLPLPGLFFLVLQYPKGHHRSLACIQMPPVQVHRNNEVHQPPGDALQAR